MRIMETKEGVVLDILVKPRSPEFKITVEAEEIIVLCKEEPVEGKANKEIVKELSRLFRNRVELVSGFSSKKKRLLVKGAEKSEIERVLGNRKTSRGP